MTELYSSFDSFPQKKIRIFFLIPSLNIGGAEKVMSILLQHISSCLFDITLCVLTDTGPFYDELPVSVKKIYTKNSRVRYSLRSIYKAVKESKPDVVFVFDVNNLNLYVGLLTFFLPSSIKFITREVTILSVFIKGFYRFYKIQAYLYKLTFKRFDLIVNQASYMKDDLVFNFNVIPEKTVIIHNPIDVNKLIQASTSNEQLVNKDTFNLLSVGRLVAVKGYDRLIKALHLLKITNFHLTILGDVTAEDPGCKNRLLELIYACKLEDKITFKGFSSNPTIYMAQSDLLIVTSHSEGFPNVVLESNAVGLPALAFNCPGGISEIIIEGFNGWLIENGDVQALANAIDKISILQPDRQKIMQHTNEHYDISKIIPIYEKTILKLTNKRFSVCNE